MSQSLAVRMVKEISGQAAVVTVPRVYIQATKDHMVAIVLSQLVYHAGKASEEWFQVSDERLGEECHVNRRQLYDIREKLEKFGVETERRGTPAKMFYKVDLEKLASKLFPEEPTVVPKGTTSCYEKEQQVLTEKEQLTSTSKKELKERERREEKTRDEIEELELTHFPPVSHTPPPKEESQTTLSSRRIEELAKEVQKPEPSARSRFIGLVTKKDKVINQMTSETRNRFGEIKTCCRLPDSVWNNWVVEIVAPEAARLGESFDVAVQGAIRTFYEATDIPKYGRTNFMTFLRGYSASGGVSKTMSGHDWADLADKEWAELQAKGG